MELAAALALRAPLPLGPGDAGRYLESGLVGLRVGLPVSKTREHAACHREGEGGTQAGSLVGEPGVRGRGPDAGGEAGGRAGEAGVGVFTMAH